jgi:PEP-CTERM motif-containing protein
MNIKKSVSALGISMALVFATGTAQSALLTFEDDDLDFLIRGDTVNDFQNPITSDTNFAVGDTILSIFEIPTFTTNGVNSIPAGQELTGVSAIKILSIIDSNPATAPLDPGTVIQFGAADLDGILAANGFAGPALGAGAAVAMFFNGAPGAPGDTDLTIGIADGAPPGNPSCTGIADCIDQATLGDKFQVDGFFGDPDEFWTAVVTVPGGANPGAILGVSNTTNLASFNAALSNSFQQGGVQVGYTDIVSGAFCGADNGMVLDGCTQVKLAGTVSGGVGIPAGHGAFGHSDFDGQKYTVPEPGTMLLLAAGLLGIGASRNIKKSKV